MDTQLYFREDQRFRSPFLWIPLIGVTAFFSGTIVWMISRQVFQDIPFGDDAMSNGKMLVLGAFILLINASLLALVASFKLQTEVTNEGLFIRVLPFHRKTRKIDLEGIAAVSAVQYRPAMEYGGWGIRTGRNGRAYNAIGNLGVRIDYEHGYHLMVGTCHPEELKMAMDAMLGAQGIALPEPTEVETPVQEDEAAPDEND